MRQPAKLAPVMRTALLVVAACWANLAPVAPAHAGERTLASVARESLYKKTIGQSGQAAGRRPSGNPASLARDPAEAVRSDYLLHCSGCHGEHGEPHSLGRIPPLQGVVGRFLHLPEGRAFLVQVPGVHNSRLDDAGIARLMNWLVPGFAGDSLRTEFKPFSAAEVREMRAHRPVDPAAYRKELARKLAELGYPIDY